MAAAPDMLPGDLPEGNGPLGDRFSRIHKGGGNQHIRRSGTRFCQVFAAFFGTLQTIIVVGRIGPSPGSSFDHYSSLHRRVHASERGSGMPGKDLTIAQRSTLLALMIKAAPLSRSFLADTVKISLDKPKRDDLVARKLITVAEKPLILELTEDGWAQAIKELDADLPPRAGALGGTLYLLLGFLRQYLDRNDLSPAEFFAAHVPAPIDLDLSAAIRKVYAEVAPAPGAYVMLEDLRSRLSDISTEAFDAALRQMDVEPDVHMVPESNQKVLTAGQRSAAFHIGGQQMHLLAILV